MSEFPAPEPRIRPMRGRDPFEEHRASTPLELLFDLTFAVAFGVAGNQFAHLVAEGHLVSGLAGFGFAMFAVVWAWINFSWFASAFDTDDWPYRVTTMVQMVGVLILALGLPQLFASIDQKGAIDNEVVVLGYVAMRIAMVAQWLRAAASDPVHRPAAVSYVVTLLVAQAGWVVLLVAPVTGAQTFIWGSVLIVVEMSGPVIAERMRGGTPWHVGHIVERHALLVIITLGEGVIGTVASISAVVDRQGWNPDAVLVAVAGIGLTFGLWWTYYILPSAEILSVRRNRSFVWGYGHLLIFAALVAVGTGLHLAATFIEGQSVLGATGTVLALALPVGLFIIFIYALYSYLVRVTDWLHALLLLGGLGALLLAVWLADAGFPMTWCLIVVTGAPLITVVGYESVGHRHRDAALRIAIGRAGAE
ncbi:low temperature requirement protein A [Microterricola viridarii]|nr:low temperature requirement protein A [Microterricola viridarii]